MSSDVLAPVAQPPRMSALLEAEPAIHLELAKAMNLARPSLLQGMQPFRDGFILAQAWKVPHGEVTGPRGAESSVFNRYDADGRYRSRMVCVTAGHCSTFATSGPYVWMAWNRVDASGEVTGRRIARLRYRAGVVTDDDPSIAWFDPHTRRSVTPALDLDHRRIGLRAVDGDRNETYTIYDLSAFKRGLDEPIGTVRTRSGDTFQGWGCYGDRLWILRGATWKPATLTEFQWGSDERIDRLDLTRKLRSIPATSYEPEGVWVSRSPDPALYVGARFGSTSKRRFLSFRVAGLAADPS